MLPCTSGVSLQLACLKGEWQALGGQELHRHIPEEGTSWHAERELSIFPPRLILFGIQFLTWVDQNNSARIYEMSTPLHPGSFLHII